MAALRHVYREDEWTSNYYLARELVKLRELSAMERTGGLSSWQEPSADEAMELTTLLARAKGQARDARTRRATELLARRAFVPRE